MGLEKPRQGISMLISASVFVCISLLLCTVDAQLSIPAKYDGFVYKDRRVHDDTIVIEAFLDPVCPDSRDSWPPLKQALEYYGPRLWLLVHPFPLPYHDNAFSTSRALHIVNKLNASVTYQVLEMFFKHQEIFYNRETYNKSKQSVDHLIGKFVAEVLGKDLLSEIESGFSDRKTDLATRVSFKYGCSRGVTGTPFFFVNGFPLPDPGSAIDYKGWKNIIDPLIGAQSQGR
ncbi:PREDICTED: uncharacterized protein LOC104604287 [Nelumbo nucifera]|uniref:Uncharacterized protein LOC104604287 n=1 Tax=Nelumbo nucifera TaxID=4432 RepID=A0A1U8AI84_NELNU|nr:PREDICTED: uncharacterized protein LOC104604287 [Nelumbo nucifera]